MKNKHISKIAKFLVFLALFCQINQVSWAKKTIIKNGNLSTSIVISEIFPNPKGSDTGKEWIELFNKGNNNINLGNWSLSITNTGKNTKPKIIKFSDKTTIEANSSLIVESPKHKFSLLNKNCKIELKDFVGKSIDTIAYQNSQENLSLSLVKIHNTPKNLTTWETPTKGITNSIYYEIEGEIKKKNISSDKNIQSSIEIRTKENKTINIHLTQKNNSELINVTIKEKDQVLFLIEKEKNKNYLLDFKITKKASPISNNKENTENWLYYSLIPIILGTTYLFHKTFGLHRIVKNLDNVSSG